MTGALQANFVKRFPRGPEIRANSLLASPKARVTVLFGPSGAGKTTVLRCVAGLLQPEEGEIRFGEETWSNAANRIFLPPRKRRIGFVPQDYSLFPHLSVEKNLAYGLQAWDRNERASRVAEMIAWLGLTSLEPRLPRDLSGGQQQRVALGRAVARRPDLLLLDEPLAALDAPTRVRLRGELQQLLKDASVPTLLVTHDRVDALALADELVVMNAGKIVQQGSPPEVFSRPASLTVAGIVAVETIQPGKVLTSGELATVAVGEQKLTAVSGELPSGVTEVYVCIRAEDVIIVRGHELARSSPRNALPAMVRELIAEGPLVRVQLDCGFALVALLTKQACEELTLAIGDRVLALVKAPNVHLIPRPKGAEALKR